MKKLTIGAILLLLLSPFAFGGQKTLNFQWEQNDRPADLAGWNLWVGDAAGGPYTDGLTFFRDANGNPVGSIDIPFSGTFGANYSASARIVVPDGTKKTLHFVVTARDTEGNVSGNSNEVTQMIDFASPDTPENLTVTVETQ